MAIFAAEGLTYSNSLLLIEALKQNDIYCNISTGGISINAKPDQVNKARQICFEHKAHFTCGYTSIEEANLQRYGDLEEIGRVRNDAIAVIKEWKV